MMMLRLLLLVLCVGFAWGQVLYTAPATLTVGTPTLWTPNQNALPTSVTADCSNYGTNVLEPCNVDQWEFALGLTGTPNPSTWVHFRFRYDIDTWQFDKNRDYGAVVSLHFSPNASYPAVGEGNILDSKVVSPFNENGILDGEYEWTLHCSFEPGYYYITVRSNSLTEVYNNTVNATEAFSYSVQICTDSVPVTPLAAFTSICDLTYPAAASCYASTNGPFTVPSYRDPYSIDALERLAYHVSFTVNDLPNQLAPGIRIRVQERYDRIQDHLGEWLVTLRLGKFTSAGYAESPNGISVCPWDHMSAPEVRENEYYERPYVYQLDAIDIWIPRCNLVLGETYYLSVIPPHTESSYDFDYTFDLVIEIDQINPVVSQDITAPGTYSFEDSIEGFLLPLGYPKDILLGRKSEFPKDEFYPQMFPGDMYPLSLPFAPLDLWNDNYGAVDRYERSARWYQFNFQGLDTLDYPSIEISLKGAQWGRRTDDGQWNQLGFKSFFPLGVTYNDYAVLFDTDAATKLASSTWLSPTALTAAMQDFTNYDVNAMREVDLFISAEGLPLSGLSWFTPFLRYGIENAPLSDYEYRTSNWQNATGLMNVTENDFNVSVTGHRGIRIGNAHLCPAPAYTCRAYPDRLHKPHDGSTSSCRITLDACQLQNFFGVGGSNILYVGVAPSKLIWANQDQAGPVTVGSSAPYQGSAPTGGVPQLANRNVLSHLVSSPYSGNPQSPNSGNWELQYTLQDMDLRFSLEVELIDHPITVLATFPSVDSNQAVYNGIASQGQTDYFSVLTTFNSSFGNFSIVNDLEIELFTAYSHQNVVVTVYEDTLMSCSAVADWTCTTNNIDPVTADRRGSCVYRISGCDLTYADSYLIAVAAVDQDEVGAPDVAYTLKATWTDLIDNIGWEVPTHQSVRPGTYNHYAFEVAENNQTVALRVRISDVQNGKVTGYVRYESPAGNDNCFLYDFTCSPAGGYSECDLVAPYCVDGAGTYYVSVYGEESTWSPASSTGPINGLIGYILTPYIHHAEWVDWMPSPDAQDPSSAVTISRSIPATLTDAGIIKFADDIVRPDVRYFFWNDDYSRLNPHLPGTQQPLIPVAGFRPFGAFSFGAFGAGPSAVLGAEAHYYYFEFSPSQATYPGGTAALVASVSMVQHEAVPQTDDTLSLFISPYAIANDLCNCWSCTARVGEDSSSTCKIVLQNCDLLPVLNASGYRLPGSDADPELWYVTIRYDQYDTRSNLPIDYVFNLEMKGTPDVALVDGEAVYGQVGAYEYQHYYFSPAVTTVETALNVELYINRDYIDSLEFFMGVGTRAGTACPEWASIPPECVTASFDDGRDAPVFSTCTFKIHPCDFDNTQDYWFSVLANPESADATSFFANGDVEYTLRVWTEPVTTLSTLGWPVTGVVTQVNHYLVTITNDFFTPNPKHLFLQLDGLNGGEIRTWVNLGSIGSSCTDAGCPGTRRPLSGEFEVEIDNCQLTLGDEYYVSVAAVSFDEPNTPIRYSIRSYTKEVVVRTVAPSEWGRSNSNPIRFSLNRLDSVVLDIQPQPALTSAVTGLPTNLANAFRTAASVHVLVTDVTWGTLQYWVNQAPVGTSGFGSYPFGIGSPECHSQTGGVTGNTLAHTPDIQHSYYYSESNTNTEDLDPQFTFQRISPDEQYFRFACDVKSLQDIYITLTATVVPEWERLPCDRTINATVYVWLEVPTLLPTPPDNFTIADTNDETSPLNWAQSPEPLTVWGPNGWENWVPKQPPSLDLIWSLTYADEYKLFAYPIDFSTTDSVGILMTASPDLVPDYTRFNLNEFPGLGFPYGNSGNVSVWGESFEAYYLFVSDAEMASGADGNAAVPGELTSFCGFSLPVAGTYWDAVSDESLVLTSCEYEYESGVLFLALRYPPFERPVYPSVNPAVAVAWDLPNSLTPDPQFVTYDLVTATVETSQAYMSSNSEPSYVSFENYTLDIFGQLVVEIPFPASWDTTFPLWTYSVKVEATQLGSESILSWSYGRQNNITMYPLIDGFINDIGISFSSGTENGYTSSCVPEYRFSGVGNPYFIDADSVCCREQEMSESRSLFLSFALNRNPNLNRFSAVPQIGDPSLTAGVRVEVKVVPYFSDIIAPATLFDVFDYTYGSIETAQVYSIVSYAFEFDFVADQLFSINITQHHDTLFTTQTMYYYLSSGAPALKSAFTASSHSNVDFGLTSPSNQNCFTPGIPFQSCSISGGCIITARNFGCHSSFVVPGVPVYFTMFTDADYGFLSANGFPSVQVDFVAETFDLPEVTIPVTEIAVVDLLFEDGFKIPYSNFLPTLPISTDPHTRSTQVRKGDLVFTISNITFYDRSGNNFDTTCSALNTAGLLFRVTTSPCGINLCNWYQESTTYPLGNDNCIWHCRIPLCQLDFLNPGDSLYVVASKSNPPNEFVYSLEVDIDEPALPTQLIDAQEVTFTANLSDVEQLYYFDYTPIISSEFSELGYVEFYLSNVGGWFDDGLRMVLRVWPETHCERDPISRSCSVVPQGFNRSGPASCFVQIDACAFDRTRDTRFFASVTIQYDNQTVSVLNLGYGQFHAFNYSLIAQTKVPTLVEDDLALAADGTWSSGEVLFDRTVIGTEQHHYRFALDDLASDYTDLEICVTASCERAGSLSPYAWEVEFEQHFFTESTPLWIPPYTPFLRTVNISSNGDYVRTPLIQQSQYLFVTWVATSDAGAVFSVLSNNTGSQWDVELVAYLFQGDFNPMWGPEEQEEHLVAVQNQGSKSEPVHLVPGATYFLVASLPQYLSGSDAVPVTFTVQYLYEPAIDFNVNARLYGWENHWATNECNEYHADLSSSGYYLDASVRSACFTLSSCELQSGDVYVSVATRDFAYPFLDNSIADDVRYEITVQATPRAAVPQIALNQWFALGSGLVTPSCSSEARTEVVVPITGVEWGSQIRLQVRSETALPGLVRACPRWRDSNDRSLYDPDNLLDRSTEHELTGDYVCDDYSLCSVLTDMAFDGSYYIYTTFLLDPCEMDNAWLYIGLSGVTEETDIRLTVDYKYIPTYLLSDATPSSLTVAGQTVPSQWQFYKFNIDPSTVPSAQWQFTVSLSDLVGGEAFTLTYARNSEYLPSVPSTGCFAASSTCFSGDSDSYCELTDSWCDAAGASAYWVGVVGQSSVNAVMSYTLEASTYQELYATIGSCETVCVSVAKGETVYLELTSEVSFVETLSLFDVRDLQGVIEIAVSQDHLPAVGGDCHIGSSWVIDSDELTFTNSDSIDDPNFFSYFYSPSNTTSSIFFPLYALNQTFTNDTLANPNLANLIANPDARDYALNRPLSDYSAFRYALPCLDDGRLFFSIYGHEDSTFTFTVRSESLFTDANAYTGTDVEIRWRSSPYDGFVMNHLAPEATSILNDFSSCQNALSASGQWPHLYSWEYSAAMAAGYRPYGYTLQFFKGAEKNANKGILIVNEDRVAAPILAASSSQWPQIPGLNPMALHLAHLDGCSTADISTLQPKEGFVSLEFCDLTPKTLYFYVLFDYHLRRDYFELPESTWRHRSVDQNGETTSTATFTRSAPTEPTNTPVPTTTTSTTTTTPTTTTTTPTSPTTTTTVITSSTSTLPPTTIPLFNGPYASPSYRPLNFVPYEYVLKIEVGPAATVLTVGDAPLTVTNCPETFNSFFDILGLFSNVFTIVPDSPRESGEVVVRISNYEGGSIRAGFFSYSDPSTCLIGPGPIHISDELFYPNGILYCSETLVNLHSDADLQLLVQTNILSSGCGCTSFDIEAVWATSPASWLTPVSLPVTAPVVVTADTYLYDIGSPNRGIIYAIPASAQVDLLHVRVADVQGANVVAVILYEDIHTPISHCGAQFNQVPFYIDQYYGHGLHGECDMYISPSELSTLNIDSVAPTFYIGVALDTQGEDVIFGYSSAIFHLEVTTSWTATSSAATTYFMSGYDIDFFETTSSSPSSVVWTIEHLSGPAIRINIQDSPYDDATWSHETVWCFSQVCTIELSTEAQVSLSTSYYVTIDREDNHWQKDSVYTISSSVGPANTVSNYTAAVGSLPFCSVILSAVYPINVVDTPNTSSVWNYGDFDAKDSEAYALFLGVGPYFWGQPSDECLAALGIWACLDTIRETNGNGFVLPPCRSQCDDVVAACGEWTLSASLPEFDCGSSRYYQGSEVGACSGSVTREYPPVIPPPPFHVNATIPAMVVDTLTTTTGTTTTTSSSTSSTTTTGTGGYNDPFHGKPPGTDLPSFSAAGQSTVSFVALFASLLVSFFVMLF